MDRFKTTLKDTQYFDVLVGYFSSSGFYQLSETIEPIDKVRILVGLVIDEDAYKTMNEYQTQTAGIGQRLNLTAPEVGAVVAFVQTLPVNNEDVDTPYGPVHLTCPDSSPGRQGICTWNTD